MAAVLGGLIIPALHRLLAHCVWCVMQTGTSGQYRINQITLQHTHYSLTAAHSIPEEYAEGGWARCFSDQRPAEKTAAVLCV